jgi:hypothetical protein
VSETSEAAPRLFKVRAAYVQLRVVNRRPSIRMRSPWVSTGAKQGGIIDAAEVHPADLQHLLTRTVTELELRDGQIHQVQRPMLVPYEASA